MVDYGASGWWSPSILEVSTIRRITSNHDTDCVNSLTDVRRSSHQIYKFSRPVEMPVFKDAVHDVAMSRLYAPNVVSIRISADFT